MMSLRFLGICLIVATSSAVIAVPVYNMQKRQSDQRIAELETLLSLHKYGIGPRRLGGRNAAGYGLIDFNYIGRKKKSYGQDEQPPTFSDTFDDLISTDRLLTTPFNYKIPSLRSASNRMVKVSSPRGKPLELSNLSSPQQMYSN